MKYPGEGVQSSAHNGDEAGSLPNSDGPEQSLANYAAQLEAADRQQTWLECREAAAQYLGIPVDQMPDMIAEDYRLIAEVCKLAARHERPGMLVELSDVARQAGTHPSRIVARYGDLIERLASCGWTDVLPPTPSDPRGIHIIEAMINAGKPAKTVGRDLGIDHQKVVWRAWQMRQRSRAD